MFYVIQNYDVALSQFCIALLLFCYSLVVKERVYYTLCCCCSVIALLLFCYSLLSTVADLVDTRLVVVYHIQNM